MCFETHVSKSSPLPGYCSLLVAHCSLLITHCSLLVARSPCGARKNTTQLAKYPHVLYAKPSNKMYLLHLPGILEGQTVVEFAKLSI